MLRCFATLSMTVILPFRALGVQRSLWAAVEAYDQALAVYSRELFPYHHTIVQRNLGVAQRLLQGKGGD